MKTRFKPLLAAAVAAGAIPVLDLVAPPATAYAATVAAFTFESLTATSGSASSYSFLAESGLATGTLVKTGSGGTLGATVGGNGSPRALSGTNFVGAALTFSFSLDDLDSVTFSFDAAGSGTAPRDFVVRYSLDGTSFSSLTTFAIPSSVTFINSTGGTFGATNFASSTSVAAFNQSFVLPASFSDSALGVAGQSGFLQILQSGTAPIASSSMGSASSGGAPRFDNVLITASVVPEPSSIGVLTLAAAALGLRRRGRQSPASRR